MEVERLDVVIGADIDGLTHGLRQAERMLASFGETVVPRLPVESLLEMDPLALRGQVQRALDAALRGDAGGDGATAFPATIPVDAALAIPVGLLVADTQAAIDAAMETPFAADAVVDLTLYPGRIHLDALVAAIRASLDRIAPRDGGGGGPRIPAFAGGGLMPHTGLAYLHAGERVLNPAESRAYEGRARGRAIVIENLYSYGADAHHLLDLLERAARDRGM